MKTKKFYLGDILSVMKNCLVSPSGLQGYYDLINFMVGAKLFNNQFSKAHEVCSPYLKKQFPQLDTPEIDFTVGELREMLKTPSGRAEPKKLVMGWLAKLSAKYGETFEVIPLPEGIYQQRDPVEELQEDAPHLGIIPVIH